MIIFSTLEQDGEKKLTLDNEHSNKKRPKNWNIWSKDDYTVIH